MDFLYHYYPKTSSFLLSLDLRIKAMLEAFDGKGQLVETLNLKAALPQASALFTNAGFIYQCFVSFQRLNLSYLFTPTPNFFEDISVNYPSLKTTKAS